MFWRKCDRYVHHYLKVFRSRVKQFTFLINLFDWTVNLAQSSMINGDAAFLT
jgi:hypothetical protein